MDAFKSSETETKLSEETHSIFSELKESLKSEDMDKRNTMKADFDGKMVTGQSPVVDYSILPHLVSGTCISMVSYMCHGSISCRNSKRSGDDRSSR